MRTSLNPSCNVINTTFYMTTEHEVDIRAPDDRHRYVIIKKCAYVGVLEKTSNT